MRDTPWSYDVDFSFFYIFPPSAIFFWIGYLWLWPALSSKYGRYRDLDPLNKKCWDQNCNSVVHSGIVVITLLIALVNEGLEREDLEAPRSQLQHIEVSISFGYFFGFAMPWLMNLYFRTDRDHRISNKIMLIHHTVVCFGEGAYLFGGAVCAFYGAVLCCAMEFSNWFFLQHIFMTQLEYEGIYMYINGILFFFVYLATRVICCTLFGILFLMDIAHYQPAHPALWIPVLMTALVYWILVFISYIWFRDLYVGVRDALKPIWKARQKARATPKMEDAASASPIQEGVDTQNV